MDLRQLDDRADEISRPEIVGPAGADEDLRRFPSRGRNFGPPLPARGAGGAATAGISCSSAAEPEPAADGSAIFTAAAATSSGSNSSASDSTTTR